jgi:hypothetical protein
MSSSFNAFFTMAGLRRRSATAAIHGTKRSELRQGSRENRDFCCVATVGRAGRANRQSDCHAILHCCYAWRAIPEMGNFLTSVSDWSSRQDNGSRLK